MTVESIDYVDIGSHPFIVFGYGYSEQVDLAAVLKRMQDGERQRIVDIVSHIRFEDDVNWGGLDWRLTHGKGRPVDRGQTGGEDNWKLHFCTFYPLDMWS